MKRKRRRRDDADAAARNNDPDTSHEAAESVDNELDRQIVFNLFNQMIKRDDQPGMTCKEMRADLIAQGYSFTRAESLRRRLSDLVKLGLLIDSGFRRGGAMIITLPIKTKKVNDSGNKSV